eukprot:4898078-Pyramimonas_sp.AAC.1
MLVNLTEFIVINHEIADLDPTGCTLGVSFPLHTSNRWVYKKTGKVEPLRHVHNVCALIDQYWQLGTLSTLVTQVVFIRNIAFISSMVIGCS